MKILLTAINAKYIHSNLAVYSLKAYCREYREYIKIAEYTINNYVADILKELYKERPDVIAFSCYIWNIEMVKMLIPELKKVLPDVKIWLGGPEVSYDAVQQMERYKEIDGIMCGEGEETFCELAAHYVDNKYELNDIRGIFYRKEELIIQTEARMPLSMDNLVFPYSDLEDFEHRIMYYETSRGCPYSCSYCLSSIEKGIRLKSMSLVEKELQFFIDKKVPQVKLIDRTFNCNHKHAMGIWRYIKEHDNGVTNFHFEISADLLTEEEIELVQTFRPGLAQFEIGVQTIYPETIQAIQRKMNLGILSDRVKKVKNGKNIHQHLDLIAGLPFEDYEQFQKSFDYVYALKPEQLQLGFLKVLKGSPIYDMAEKYGIVYSGFAPYEVLSTNWMSYKEILLLKRIEEMVEIYYNSGQFITAVSYLERFFSSAFQMYGQLGSFINRNEKVGTSHARISRYYQLLDFVKSYLPEQEEVMQELLIYDLYLRENLKTRPSFKSDTKEERVCIKQWYGSEEAGHILATYAGYDIQQKSRMTHIEHFSYDIEKIIAGEDAQKADCYILFDYKERNPLDKQCRTVRILQ